MTTFRSRHPDARSQFEYERSPVDNVLNRHRKRGARNDRQPALPLR